MKLLKRIMDNNFSQNEFLLRAVYPENIKPFYWKNGHLSSAALKDKKGLSVDRTYSRDLLASAIEMRKRNLKGYIFSFSVTSCLKVNTYLFYNPSKENIYHSEIHSSKTRVDLTDHQAYILSREAKVVLKPDEYIS